MNTLKPLIQRQAIIVVLMIGVLFGLTGTAQAVFWNLFNAENDFGISARYHTYNTLTDMLNDTNRTSTIGLAPNGSGAGANVVGSGSDGTTYWNLFNAENDFGISARYHTYNTLTDMLNDTNRTSTIGLAPNGSGAGANVVGSGSDGTTYWNLFNAENDFGISARYHTYNTLTDMLNDTNRTSTIGLAPNGSGAGANVVGSGSDGTTYWNLFNAENDFGISARYHTYNTLTDMLNDTNRTSTIGLAPNGSGAGANVVGSGAMLLVGPGPGPIPEPSTMILFGTGLAGLSAWRLKKGKQT